MCSELNPGAVAVTSRDGPRYRVKAGSRYIGISKPNISIHFKFDWREDKGDLGQDIIDIFDFFNKAGGPSKCPGEWVRVETDHFLAFAWWQDDT